MDAPPTSRRALTSAVQLNALRKPGRHSIGDGLLFVVGSSGSKSWLARVRDTYGKRRDIGLGRFPEVGLREARERAAELRRQVRDGLDPVEEKKKARDTVPTFEEAAELAHGERKAGFRNKKHAAQWITSLRTYAYPKLGNVRVDAVSGPLIVQAMKNIWTSKPETARRTLQRIGTVIAWSAAHGFCQHEAPMQSIRMGLPPQPKNKKNHAAVPYADAPSIVGKLFDGEDSVGRDALRFLILTAARSGEARATEWDEIDLERATWTVPAERMKMSKEHIVPLSPLAVAMLKRLEAVRSDTPFVFSTYTGRPVSDAALMQVMRKMDCPATVHGWRSTFRDWGAEETNYANEVLEKALAHQIPNAVERSYRRGDLLEKRRALMKDWAQFLLGEQPEIEKLP